MDEKARLARYPGPWKWEDGKFTVEIRGHGGTMTAERADTEAMEAARRIMERDAPAFLVPGKLGHDAVTVARALLQQREAIIEECYQAAWGAMRHGTVNQRVLDAIRALAARKETPNE